MEDTSKALEALDRIFNYCEEIDLHIPEEEQTGYSMNDDVVIIREALFTLSLMSRGIPYVAVDGKIYKLTDEKGE